MVEQSPDIQNPQDSSVEKPTLAELWAARQQRIGELHDKPPVRIPTDSGLEAAASLGAAVSKLLEGRLDG
jgi:hypothetical protein